MSDYRPSVELLESTHSFPCQYQIKAIGRTEADFVSHAVDAVVGELASALELDYTIRSTQGGRHVALTLDITVQNAEQVRSIYAKLHEVKGLTLLF
ncbi:MAG: hypothetical protein NVSMB14_11830 [Isosphaeraceae bacterium]